MRFAAAKTAGTAIRSADPGRHGSFAALLLAVLFLATPPMSPAQSMYKYRGPDGEWIYSDRQPEGGQPSEIRELPTGTTAPTVEVSHRLVDRQIRFVANNTFHAPVQLIIKLQRLINVAAPGIDDSLSWTLPARSTSNVMALDAIADNLAPGVEYRVAWLPGDPTAQHRPTDSYRAPFAVARSFPITQAYPLSVTHTTSDSLHAVDIAMPVGTNVYAARSGMVFEVASTNYRGGLDTSREGAEANVIHILHDDGTFALYAHLNWNTIRVRPGDVVQRGEYIADSGNTGFSTGPHLHFAVMRNRGLRLESLPILFEGRDGVRVQPRAGAELGAY